MHKQRTTGRTSGQPLRCAAPPFEACARRRERCSSTPKTRPMMCTPPPSDTRASFASPTQLEQHPRIIHAEIPGQTILSGASSIRLGGRHVVVDSLVFRNFVDQNHILSFRANENQHAEDCRLTNSVFESPISTDNDADRSSYWVSIYGKRNRVDDCSFVGKRTHSPTLTVWVNTDNTEFPMTA